MDGTLTPPRLPMTEDFAETFVPWLAHHKAFIATGSDFAKVKEQLPDSVIKEALQKPPCQAGWNKNVLFGFS